MLEKIKIGLIGCGRIAGHHFKAVKNNKYFEIISVCDLDINKANLYAKKHKINLRSNF